MFVKKETTHNRRRRREKKEEVEGKRKEKEPIIRELEQMRNKRGNPVQNIIKSYRSYMSHISPSKTKGRTSSKKTPNYSKFSLPKKDNAPQICNFSYGGYIELSKLFFQLLCGDEQVGEKKRLEKAKATHAKRRCTNK